MPRIINQTALNASTIDILNVIRANGSLNYQNLVPAVETERDIPAVGEAILGNPGLANEFINSLINRIGLVMAESATFNNPYRVLKRGKLEFGESVEDIFVGIAKVLHYSAEKAASREMKRYLPDVKALFHLVNWKVLYPLTVEREQLELAFLSLDGVTDMINKLVEGIYTAAEYDEFLLFKYMLIKAANEGAFKSISVGDGTDPTVAAKRFRGTSNRMTFMLNEYNAAGVKNSAPKDRQVIFMDSDFNADFDVDVLAKAFNMDKADFMGRLFLIDDWTEFDNARWEEIRAESDGLEEVTDAELSFMASVKAILLDERFFQVYDKLNEMTEDRVAAGLYWNYFYHTWKIVSWSPFANAAIFVTSGSSALTQIDSLTFTVTNVSNMAGGLLIGLDLTAASASGSAVVGFRDYEFVQNSDLMTAGVAVQKYGAIMAPVNGTAEDTEVSKLTVTVNGQTLVNASTDALDELAVGDTITFTTGA